MQQKTITLASGEVLVVEKSQALLNSGALVVTHINLWETCDGKRDIAVASVTKSWRQFRNIFVWMPATTRMILEFPAGDRNEIAQHAARLAAELDEQYKPGTEVAA